METNELMAAVLTSDNLRTAWKRVKANKGAPGIDGIAIEDYPAYLRTHWESIRHQLETGRYRPEAVRRVEIPKDDGGKRLLGIPTVMDRVIQQAIAQVLTPIFEPRFSGSSFGFRPGRNAHQAIRQVQQHVKDGYRFARYADDMVILVKSQRAGERVMQSLTRYLEGRLKLKLNPAKSKVARMSECGFLGFTIKEE